MVLQNIILQTFFFLGSEVVQAQNLHLQKVTYWGNNNYQSIVPEGGIRTVDNGIFFTGYSDNTGGNGIPGCIPKSHHAFYGKIDSNGKLEWAKADCNQYDAGNSSIQLPDGGYAAPARYNTDTTGFNMVRYDKNGNVQWYKRHGGYDCGVSEIALAKDKGFVLFGSTKRRYADIPFTYVWPPGSFPPDDWVLMKLDSIGNLEWTKTFGTSGDDGYSCLLPISNSYYIIGTTVSLDHECADVANHAGSATYTMKFDSEGNFLWSRGYNIGGMPHALYDERDNTIVIWGYEYTNTNEIQGNHGGDDMLVMKQDTLGNLIWAKQFGGPKDERPVSLCQGPGSSYLLTGNVSPNPLNNEAPFWVVWIDSAGGVIDEQMFGGIQGELSSGIFYNSNKNYAEVLGGSASHRFAWSNDTNMIGFNMFLARFTFDKTSVQESKMTQSAISIAPNPAHNIARLKWSGLHSKGLITCINSAGQEVYQQQVESSERQREILMVQWPVGSYVICWQPQDGFRQCKTLNIQ